MYDESPLYVSAPECNLQGNFIVVSHFCLMRICEFYVTPLRWHSGAETCVGDIYHEFVVWFVIYCILISAFVGQYIEYREMHCMCNIKQVIFRGSYSSENYEVIFHVYTVHYEISTLLLAD
jgi:hypothetical protein